MSTRLLKGILTWLVVPLHLAMGVVPASGLLLCVAPGHFDIETPHAGIPCHSAPHEHAPRSGCVDVAVVGAPVERSPSAASSLTPPLWSPTSVHPALFSRGGSGAVVPLDCVPPERQSLTALRTIVLQS